MSGPSMRRPPPPDLFGATLLDDPEGLLAFPAAGAEVWRHADGWWVAAAPAGDRGGPRTAYRDPARGIVLVTWEGDELVRRVWGGGELGRARVTLEQRHFTSCAFDPTRELLIVCGGDSGLTPWTLLVDARHELMLLPPVRWVAFDPPRARFVAIADIEVDATSVSGVPPTLCHLDGAAWRSLGVVGESMWSSLAYDPVRRTVIGFIQPVRGTPALLHVLAGDRFVPDEPPLQAPERNLFGVVRAGDELIVWGGQVFTGGENHLLRLRGRQWLEETP